MADLAELSRRLGRADGCDPALDEMVAAVFGVGRKPYTMSIEDCRALVAEALPGWRLHVGFGVSGVLPYAALASDGLHVEAEAGTVPLAILKAAVLAAEPPAPAPGQ